MSTRINHASVNARDLRESVAFYVELLAAEQIPAPNFGVPVAWLALGDTQLHLFERDLQPTSHHHFAVTVEDLEPAYRAAARRGAFDRTAFGNHLVEIDAPGVARLPDDVRPQLTGLWDLHAQTDGNMSGRLFVPG